MSAAEVASRVRAIDGWQQRLVEGDAPPLTDDDSPPGDGWRARQAEADNEAAEAPKLEPLTPAEIVAQWQAEGPLVRVPTGIAPLDEMSRGGIPIPWRVIIVGAPSAGKTFVSTVIADTWARRLAADGVAVGIVAVDEEPDDVTIRLAQLAGFTVEQAEQREPAMLVEMTRALAPLRVRLYDVRWTIEAAGTDLAAWAASLGMKAALFVDSLHTARSVGSLDADTERAKVIANVDAVRVVSTAHSMLVVATSEANRNAYAVEVAAAERNDLAAGAEARQLEYGAKTMLVLRTPKGHGDVISVTVAKNRRAERGTFFLEMDRHRHTVTPCADPSPPESTETRAEKKRTSVVEGVERDARDLASYVRSHPGMSVRALRAAMKSECGMGHERTDAAIARLTVGVGDDRLVNRGASKSGHGHAYYLESTEAANA